MGLPTTHEEKEPKPTDVVGAVAVAPEYREADGDWELFWQVRWSRDPTADLDTLSIIFWELEILSDWRITDNPRLSGGSTRFAEGLVTAI